MVLPTDTKRELLHKGNKYVINRRGRDEAAKKTVIKANTDFESSYHEKIQG